MVYMTLAERFFKLLLRFLGRERGLNPGQGQGCDKEDFEIRESHDGQR